MRCPGSTVMPVSVQILLPSSVNSLDCSCFPAAPALTAGVCPEGAGGGASPTSWAAEGFAPASKTSDAIVGRKAANLPVVFITSILSCRADPLLYAKQRRRRQAATQGDSPSLMGSYMEPTIVVLFPGNGWTTLAAGAVIPLVMARARPDRVARREGGGVSLTHRMGACTLADGRSSVSHGRPYVQASPP